LYEENQRPVVLESFRLVERGIPGVPHTILNSETRTPRTDAVLAEIGGGSNETAACLDKTKPFFAPWSSDIKTWKVMETGSA